jgi:hypothetical protein
MKRPVNLLKRAFSSNVSLIFKNEYKGKAGRLCLYSYTNCTVNSMAGVFEF